MAEAENVVVLDDGEGNPLRFEFLDLIPYGGHNYVVLYPLDEEDDGQVVVMMVDEDPNVKEESYVEVNDDATVQAVYQIFKENNKDSFDFDDGTNETPVAAGGKPMKCRARLGVLFIAWLGAWAGLHLNWMGYHEAAKNFRKSMGGIFCIINPVCWIMHIVEVFKVLFGGYRTDAYGRPIRYFAFLRKVK